jgi:hypothetical protein
VRAVVLRQDVWTYSSPHTAAYETVHTAQPATTQTSPRAWHPHPTPTHDMKSLHSVCCRCEPKGRLVLTSDGRSLLANQHPSPSSSVLLPYFALLWKQQSQQKHLALVSTKLWPRCPAHVLQTVVSRRSRLESILGRCGCHVQQTT